MKYILVILGIIFLSISCGNSCAKAQNNPYKNNSAENYLSINPEGKTIETRFSVPHGCQRINYPVNSFQSYLRNLPVKTDGTLVSYYNGDKKQNHNIYHAVVDLPIGNKNLHQCADAVMRLRAEYLWKNERYEDIHFNFTNGFQVDYIEWMKGRRMIVEGNKTFWNNRNNPSNTYNDWWKYMELIFNYAGTLSLDKELSPIQKNDMKIGDVFIIGGSPGHAVIVVDMCENIQTKERYFMLAQSYMPAQEIQILQNPSNKLLSPWYRLTDKHTFETPEWNFDYSHLKRF